MLGIIVLPGIILAIYAELKVKRSFDKYSSVLSGCGKPAHEIARMFLDTAGLNEIQIVGIRGHLTDYYHHRKKIIALSENIVESTSISAIGVLVTKLDMLFNIRLEISLLNLEI